MQLNQWQRKLLTILVTIAAALAGVSIVSTDDNGGGRPEKTTVTIHVDRSADPGIQGKALQVPEEAVAEAADSPELEPLLSVANVPAATIEHVREVEDRLAANDQLPIVTPDAAPQQRGCTSNFVRNYSSRRGVAPRWIIVHETVSPNLPGIEDLLGLTARANDPRTQVSWHYNIDRPGNCFYTVRESDKAWTAAAANSFGVQIEFVNTTREFPFLLPAGYAKAGLVMSDIAARWHIPLALGKVNDCAPPPDGAGVISHAMLGFCGGGHVDINSHDGSDHAELRRLIAAAKAARKPPCGKRCRAKKRQRAVVAGRVRHHEALHKEYARAGCRRDMHHQPLRTYTRRQCRQLKRRGHSQHKAITRARRTLRAL
jgi:hypothetical protein